MESKDININTSPQVGGVKGILLSRHKLLPAQERAIEKAGISVVKTIGTVPNPGTPEFREFITILQKEGIKVIVTTGIPPHILASLNKFFDVYFLKMETIDMVSNRGEAEQWVAKSPEFRTYVPSREGTYRLVEFIALVKVKITIEETVVVSSEELRGE